MLQFDAATSRLLENAYHGADIAKRRLANYDALAARPGERILDIGCGPGFFLLELARAVDDSGSVIGVDPSADMRDMASRRCRDHDNVSVVEGTANSLPLPDQSIDRAVAIQVFEYLDDIPGAVSEVRRVLRPNGRLVVGDIHWDSLVWFSEDRARMARMVEAWDRQRAERCVPALLPHVLRETGFAVEAVTPVVCCDATLRADGLARMLLLLMEAFAVQNSRIDGQEAQAWAAEQRELAAAGRFFFAVTHFVVSGRKI